MLEKIIELDKELFLFLNSLHADWLDPIMLLLSSYADWIIVCLLMLILIYIKGKEWKKEAVISFLLTLGVSALLTDLIKRIFDRPRPIHNPAWNNVIHAIEEYESSYSFFSSHSATTFTMAIFFLLFFRREKVYGYIAILWATAVAYSRIYLAKHYPLDVLVGIMFGIMMGVIGYKLFEYYKKQRRGLKP